MTCATRPILNLSFLSKIFEKTVAGHFQKQLHDNNLPEMVFGGFLMESRQLLIAFDRGLLSVLILANPSTAFDTVDHCTLLRRLKGSIVFKDQALNVFSSYLSHNFQFVHVHIHSSDSVPQAPLLGLVGSGTPSFHLNVTL